MAGAGRLTGRSGGRTLALLGAVLLLHVAAIDWLGRQLQHTTLLQPLAEPMFTRVLQPQAPPEPPFPPAPEAPRARPAVRTVPPAAAAPAPAASAPPPVAARETEVPEANTPETQASGTQAPEPAQAPELPPDTAMAPPHVPSPASVEQAEEVAAAPSPAAPASAPAPAASGPPASPAAEAPAVALAAEPGASAPAGPAVDSWPADTRVNYRLGGVFRSGALHGDARVRWLRQDQRYEVRIDIDVTLLARLVMTSQGRVTPQGLKPEVYEEQRRSGVRRATLGDQAIVLGGGEVVQRPDGVQDTASQFVELSHRFASGRERLEVGRSVQLWLARPGHLALWTYDVVEREILQTAGLGAVEAFHLKPRPLANPRGNITAEMWFAPSLQYLPVRIKVNMEPAYVDLMVESIDQR